MPAEVKTRIRIVASIVAGLALVAFQTGTAAAIPPSSYVTKQSSVTVSAGSAAAATATCPSGDLVVTGGVYWTSTKSGVSDPTLSTTVRSSAPKPDLSGWYAAGVNNTSQPMNMTSTAQCVPKSALGKYTVLTRDVIVDPSLPGNAALQCKTGQDVVAGGGIWRQPGHKPNPSLPTLITSSAAFGNRAWLTVGRNSGLTNGSLTMRVIALCVPVTKLGGSKGSPTGSTNAVINIGDPVEQYAYCPAGKRAVAGGTNWGSAGGSIDTDTGNVIESSSVTADGTGWYASGRRADPRHNGTTEYFSVRAYCQ